MKRQGSRKSTAAAVIDFQDSGQLFGDLTKELSASISEADLLRRVLRLVAGRWEPVAVFVAVPEPGAPSRYLVFQESKLEEPEQRAISDFVEKVLRSSPETLPLEIFDSFSFLKGLSKYCIRSSAGSSERLLLLLFGGNQISAAVDSGALRSLVQIVEMKVANLRLREAMDRRMHNLSGLHKSAEGMSRMLLDVSELMESITREAIRFLRMDAAAVLIPEDETRLNYTVRAQTGFAEGKIPLSPDLFSRAFDEFYTNLRKAIVHKGSENQTFLLVPLIQRGDPCGVLFLYSGNPGFRLTEDQTQIAEIYGDWASMAIENAIMLERVTNSQREWENTFDSIADPIYIIDNEYRLKKMNKSLAAFTMKNINLPEDRDCYRFLFHRGTICPWCPVPEGMKSSQPVTVEAPLFSGGIWQIQSFPFTDKSEQRIGSIHVLRDLTVLKTMQEQLIESEKLASAGKLISGVAHEVRNPLFGISTTVRALANELGNKEELKPFLDIITNETVRLNRLMEDLLNYSRPVQIDKNPSDISEIVSEVIQQFEQNATIHLFISDTIPAISVDSNKVRQVLINLFENAIQHSGENPAIDVFLEYLSLSSPPAIHMVIKDHGKGISPENLKRVFDPFFTTRQRGTGLGLSIVRKVLHDHGGRIGVESHVGVGTTFRIALPAAPLKA